MIAYASKDAKTITQCNSIVSEDGDFPENADECRETIDACCDAYVAPENGGEEDGAEGCAKSCGVEEGYEGDLCGLGPGTIKCLVGCRSHWLGLCS